MFRAVMRTQQHGARLATQIEKWRAGRTPTGGFKSEGRREACKVLEANVAELRLHSVATKLFGPSQQMRAVQRARWQVHGLRRAPRKAYSGFARKPSPYSNRDYNLRACMASSHSIVCSPGPGSSPTCSLRIAGTTKRPRPVRRISP